MTIKHAAIISVSAIVALCTPLDIPAHARGGGFGMHSFHSIDSLHFAKHFRHARGHRNFNQGSLYGGVYATPPYDNYAAQAQPTNFVYVVEPPRVHSCQY
ncbi:MAG: hypothetical protein WCA54_12130, partial [Pseudolabrys sp.]